MREEIADEVGMSVMADVVEVDSVAAKPVSTALSDVTNNGIAKQLSGMVSGIKVNGVKGRVIDKVGEPIVGATVTVRGTNNGTVSDVNGNFTLPMNDGKEITVNYIGYEPVILPADTSKEMLIAMNEDSR